MLSVEQTYGNTERKSKNICGPHLVRKSNPTDPLGKTIHLPKLVREKPGVVEVKEKERPKGRNRSARRHVPSLTEREETKQTGHLEGPQDRHKERPKTSFCKSLEDFKDAAVVKNKVV